MSLKILRIRLLSTSSIPEYLELLRVSEEENAHFGLVEDL